MFAVAVSAIKGGAGKSTIAANIALSLAERGHRVAFLDADLDSPYFVEIIGVKGRIELDEKRRMIPVEHNGLRIMSFALWTPDEFSGSSMHGETHEVWVRDALRHTDWGDADVLVIDLPAGASSSYLSVLEAAREMLVGLVAVAQPNVVTALERVYNASAYHRVRVLGVIENMAGDVFGSGKVQAFCERKGLRFFGSIPLSVKIREGNERGEARLPVEFRGPVESAVNAFLERAGFSKGRA